MGEGIVEKLKKEFDLAVEWKGVEIHPETPSGGRLLSELFPARDLAGMMEHLRSMGAPFGITYADRPFLSNSRRALLAAEFGREQGRFQALHESLFAAYFSRGLDIGDLDVLKALAKDAGLDPEAMAEAVQSNRHLPVLEATKEEATRLGVTGVPTFFIGKKSVVGAQPLDVFRKMLRSVAAKS